ncbi:hypothetical protein [Herbaspirillum sp. GW103]|uniref:hypothetical protein n=1 Tax=Herbaspirillum sp. GW103 TaxID=1175306 RepID=UPI0012F68737|nr:hypothetical protein [Herbaspirillum sp. GW103]
MISTSEAGQLRNTTYAILIALAAHQANASAAMASPLTSIWRKNDTPQYRASDPDHPCSASNIELRNSFRGGANGFAFKAGTRTVSIPLGIRVSDWAVNCSRTRAIAWGQDLSKARIGAPPVNKVYVIDLTKRKPINHFTRTRGPYEAAFSRNHKTAIVDHDIVDLTTGKVVDVIYDMNLDLETCPAFPGKQSN